jgi:pre-mRNA-splicing factor ATP-dependent RNA helicase DHX15/PRP43
MVNISLCLFQNSESPCCRLLEYAGAYYDVKDFPAGETKNALMRVLNKKLGRSMGSHQAQSGGDDGPKRKKKKKEHPAPQASGTYYTQPPVQAK